MLMPGRSGSLINGEWTEGGNAVLANLTIDIRSGNQPVEYVASESIEFLPGFESGVGDAFVAYIDPEAVGGNGAEGNGLYRYGFNGKENDNEVKGEGNQQDYGMRMYDGRLGRFLSVDPITKDYPELTPYQFASNTPIQAIDLDGLEALVVTGGLNFFGLFVGYDIGAGFAISPTGIAFYAGQTFKGGLGLEIGGGVNASFFPTMTDLNDLDGLSVGGSIAGAALGKLGFGAVKSSGKWGATMSYGFGVGAHASADFGLTIKLNIVTWDKIAETIIEGTEEGKAIAKAFGINKSNLNSAVQIVKDFYKKTSFELIDKRISDLQNKINDNTSAIRAGEEYLKDYQSSGKFYKILNFFTMNKVQDGLKAAKEETQEDAKEIKLLQEVKQKY